MRVVVSVLIQFDFNVIFSFIFAHIQIRTERERQTTGRTNGVQRMCQMTWKNELCFVCVRVWFCFGSVVRMNIISIICEFVCERVKLWMINVIAYYVINCGLWLDWLESINSYNNIQISNAFVYVVLCHPLNSVLNWWVALSGRERAEYVGLCKLCDLSDQL